MAKKRTAASASKIKTRTSTKHPPRSPNLHLAALKKLSSKARATLLARSAEEDTQYNLRRSYAFRDLETPIFELYLQAEIAAEVAVGQHEDQSELALFAVYRFGEMARNLKAKYLAID